MDQITAKYTSEKEIEREQERKTVYYFYNIAGESDEISIRYEL